MFIADAAAAVASLLAGTIDYTGSFVINPEDGVNLEQQWATSKAGEIMWSPTTHRAALIQLRPDYADPRALVDVRVRRAVAHGFDVPSVVETLNYGKGLQTPTLTAPTVPYYAAIDKLITRYAYDSRLVAQGIEPAGFTRGADGIYVDASGTRFSVEISAVGDDKNIQESAFFVDSLKRTGLDASAVCLSTSPDE